MWERARFTWSANNANKKLSGSSNQSKPCDARIVSLLSNNWSECYKVVAARTHAAATHLLLSLNVWPHETFVGTRAVGQLGARCVYCRTRQVPVLPPFVNALFAHSRRHRAPAVGCGVIRGTRELTSPFFHWLLTHSANRPRYRPVSRVLRFTSSSTIDLSEVQSRSARRFSRDTAARRAGADFAPRGSRRALPRRGRRAGGSCCLA